MKKFFTFLCVSLICCSVFCSCEDDDDFSTSNTYSVSGSENGKDYVDLGLSVKWAAYNVGATKPEGYGDYYAWGETSTKNQYERSTYKYYNASNDKITKYCDSDNLVSLEPEDDVAHVKWGGKWRMPKKTEIQELIDNCTWTWTSQNNVNGYRGTADNGNSIFIPAAGSRGNEDYHFDEGEKGGFWSSTRTSYHSFYAYATCGWSIDGLMRCNGLPVRPVFSE